MIIKGTREAFLLMLGEPGINKKLGLSRSYISNLKAGLAGNNDNNRPSLEKMEELLDKYGATVAHEKTWKLPT